MDLDSEELSTNLNPKSSSNDLNNFETHNYPSNKKITYKKHNKYYLYEIIKEGIYPETLKYTKSNGKGDTCPIPNEYLVETEFGRTTKYKFQCSIRYYNNNPIYYLNWKDGEGKIHQVTSQKSSTDAAQKYFQANDKNTTNMSGILLFGLQLQCVHNQCIHKQNKNKKNKLISFEEAKDTTCRYRLKSLGNQFLDDFNKSSNSILNSNSSEIVGITIKINDQLYQLCFKEDEDEKKLHAEAVAQQLDVHNISQAGYQDIDKNGFIDSDGLKWKTILYFSSDWKFLSICLGINNATAINFCPWCLCSKSDHSKLELEWNISKKMEIIKSNYQAYAGHKHAPLFTMISLTHWIPDELHLMLRITDRLWSLMLEETDLMGGDKMKVLKNFDIESILPKNRSDLIRELWNGFDILYTALKDSTTDPVFFKNQAKLWLNKFLTPSIGNPRKGNYIKGLYTNNDVTPYIHVLVHHIHEFMTIHHSFGIKDGGKGKKKAVIEILEHENRTLYYKYNEIPTINKSIKKVKII
ncbi:9325_t:CDS:2 [Entrophospora sp. SA101]|nr:9325_t:CDS:2 [Entrophospora sp. SA101]